MNDGVQKQLDQKDEIIKSLQKKLSMKELGLVTLTTGYLKDLQIMRDQMHRSNQEETEYYEVQYFNLTEVDEPKYRDLLNTRMADLKSQYEHITREQKVRTEQLRLETKNLKLQLHLLREKSKSLDNPEYLMRLAMHLERNPYLIWKMIQDMKGNFYFEEVFSSQRTSFGINYKEVNRLLMKSKAYDKDFASYKQGIDDQMVGFMESVSKQMKNMQEQLDLKQ